MSVSGEQGEPGQDAPMASPGVSLPTAAALAAGPALAPAATPPMDAAFIERNQIIERYLTGKLPPRGVIDFERYCLANPQLVDSLGLTDRINAALKLLDASGRPEPWAEKPRRFYENAVAFFSALGVCAVALVLAVLMSGRATEAERQVALLEKQVGERPLLPATSTRTIVVEPSKTGPSQRAALTLLGSSGEMADLKVDVSWSRFTNYRVTIDRINQGRVAVLGNLQRDSNGQLRIALNSSALGPGEYQLTLDGLDWRGNPDPQGWVTFSVVP
jgi:hypothetical protein